MIRMRSARRIKTYIIKRSTARNFIKNMDIEDIEEFEQLIQERKERND